MAKSYGQDITYTDFWGSKTTCGVSGLDTPDEALNEALKLAKLDGWSPPRWWQWWRRNDTRISEPEPATTERSA
jgi:hypothetical protein